MILSALLKDAVDSNASDLYLVAGAIPGMTVDGVMRVPPSCGNQRVSPDQTTEFARQIMSEFHWNEFEAKRELNMAYYAPGIGRFRVNFLWQRGSIGIVVRRVVEDIPTLRSLGLPPVLRNIALSDRGIVILSGATGSGKSTSMASMIEYRNHLRNGHIVTLEDPIEFVYQHRRSIVTQREVGVDTMSFAEALRNSLRQAPSVISIGEMRDADTLRFALHASETGHLVFATLHSTNAVQTLERVLHFFPSEAHEQVLMQLALNLKAIICQRLIPKPTEGRACAAEVLFNTPRVQDLIAKNELVSLREFLKSEAEEGCQSFDLALYRLCKRGLITKESAMRAADSYNELEMKFRGLGVTPGSPWENLSDPWANIADDYEWPHGYRESMDMALVEGGYSNEGAAPISTGQSGITPMLKMEAEPPTQPMPRRAAVAQIVPPERKPAPTTPAELEANRKLSVAQRYRQMIEDATKDKRPLTDIDLDLDI